MRFGEWNGSEKGIPENVRLLMRRVTQPGSLGDVAPIDVSGACNNRVLWSKRQTTTRNHCVFVYDDMSRPVSVRLF